MNRRRFSAAMLAGSAAALGVFRSRNATAQDVAGNPGMDTWQPSGRARSVFGSERPKLARAIWDAYGLTSPNSYDTVDAFCAAILADWSRERSAYVWRYASTAGHQVYVLPSRFTLAHPPFLPDFPEGYYRLDPACEVDDAKSCIHPMAFFRILPGESVDEYAPGDVIPTR